ncbi:protein ECERIFERUM 2-like [Diospyros lotus]|uniref:protein ECERIFERUM 2-like n=1 Tax=Diospyros lotus TaxID=55363 RepID=UPI002256390D|nr:protein ECERIFERUM 2-like [Diospyros lotus]
MMMSGDENPVYDVKLSSVVPSRVTSEDRADQEVTSMDLALKLHYIRGLYFFRRTDVVAGMDIIDLKRPTFKLLDLYYPASGRIRRRTDQEGRRRPFIKCNDGGVRIVEAKCRKTLDEWLSFNHNHQYSVSDHLLVHAQVLGPDLSFSPLVFLQFTRFKCGGLSVGLSWAHILGDAFCASAFMNTWAQIVAGNVPSPPPTMPDPGNSHFRLSAAEKPRSLKSVPPVGDCWLASGNCKMEVYSFHVTARQLEQIIPPITGAKGSSKPAYFQVLAALIWKSLAKVRGESGPSVVTICRRDPQKRKSEIFGNSLVIGTVGADFKVQEAGLLELAELIAGKMEDESNAIEEFVEREKEKPDLVVYGANLTFVNLEELNVYELQLGGENPVFVNYTVGGVGDEGVVLVLPAAPEGGSGGRTVTAILPENQIVELKNEVGKHLDWPIF